MRLLLVTHYFPSHRGGIEIVAGQLAQRLAARGVEIAWAASDVTTGDDAPGAVPMRTWNFTENRLGFPYPLWSPASLGRLRQLVDWCDVVHLHDSLYAGNIVAARLARQRGKPIVVTQHIGEVPYRSPVLRNLLRVANRTIARRVLGSCDRAIFISPRIRAYFQGFVRFRTPPLFLPNGVDTQTYQPATSERRQELRSKLGWSVDRAVSLFVGRYVEKKGLLLLREAARQRPDCDFVFAGWGPLDPTGWKLPNARSLGSLAAHQLAECYQSADLLVLPSVGEGFPLVIQEAAACGTPALISRETALGHEDVQPFTYLCDPDVTSIVEKLDEILRERIELTKRRGLAAKFASDNWNWDRLANEYVQIFNAIV